jgi:hypothetical protein
MRRNPLTRLCLGRHYRNLGLRAFAVQHASRNRNRET